MSFDVFTPDPDPPGDRRVLIVSTARRRLARRRAAVASGAAVLVLAALLPIALRSSNGDDDLRTTGRVAAAPTSTANVPDTSTTVAAPATTIPTTAAPPSSVVRALQPGVTTPTAPAACTPTQPLSPTHRGRILFTRHANQEGHTLSVNPDGTDLHELSDGAFDVEPAWSPEGDRIAFARDALIYVMNADGTGLRKLTDGPDTKPSWSPDGTRIAFVRQNPFALMVMKADGTGLTVVLLTGAKVPYGVAWSTDSCRLIYGICCEQNGIWSIRTDGSEPQQLHPSGSEPSVGPDGDIAFGDSSDGASGIFILKADGSGVVQVGPECGRPSWSPDGSRIACERFINGAWNIMSMKRDGTDVQAVTTTTDTDLYANW
jgi:dipeptidyl aminopeptidase/acylaminoacyl peptidase